jgi:hypothetical protein
VPRPVGLLRSGSEWPGGSYATEESDELAPLHVVSREAPLAQLESLDTLRLGGEEKLGPIQAQTLIWLDVRDRHFRTSAGTIARSALSQLTDIVRPLRQVRKVPIPEVGALPIVPRRPCAACRSPRHFHRDISQASVWISMLK